MLIYKYLYKNIYVRNTFIHIYTYTPTSTHIYHTHIYIYIIFRQNSSQRTKSDGNLCEFYSPYNVPVILNEVFGPAVLGGGL